MNRHRSASLAALMLLVTACAGGDQTGTPAAGNDGEQAKGLSLAALQYKDNKALLFAGSGEHKEFMAKVVPAVASWFDEPDVGFKSQHYADLSVAEIKARIQEAATAISNEGTLALYFLTHGSPDGYMLARDRVFRMSEVVGAISAAGRPQPLRRLMVFVETCYSGNQVNTLGLASMASEPPADGTPLPMDNDDPWYQDLAAGQGGVPGTLGLAGSTLYQQAVIVTSSKSNQLSNVPVFANALYKSFIDHNDSDNATIAQWLTSVRQHTLADAPKPQEPQWKGIPESVLQERLWMPVRAPAPGGDAGVAKELLDRPITPDQATATGQSGTVPGEAAATGTGTTTATGASVDTGLAGGAAGTATLTGVTQQNGGSAAAEDDDDVTAVNKAKKPRKPAGKAEPPPGNGCGTVGIGEGTGGGAMVRLLLLLLLPLLITIRRL